MAMSGDSAWAAVSAPRRLNSSCTEKTRCTVGLRAHRGKRAADLDDHRAGGSIVDRRAGNAVAGEADDLRLVHHRCSYIDAGGERLRSAGKAGVDIELGVRQDPVFLVLRGGVMALVGDDAGNVPPVADAEEHGLRRERLLRHAAEALDPDQPIRLDLADDEAELIHMGEEHDAGIAAVAFERGNEVAEAVGARVDAERFQLCREIPPDAAFMAAEARNEHQLGDERAQPALQGIRFHRVARSTRSPQSTERLK